MIRAFLVLLAPLALVACRTAPLTPIDEASAILDRHVEVTGGRDAYAHDFRVSKGTVLYKSLNTLCNLTVHETRSTDRRWHSRSEATGDQEEGSFEDAAWSYALMSGLSVLEGEALGHILRAAPIDAAVRWRELFEHARLLPTRSVDGRPAQAVELFPPSGQSEVRFFDVETGLHIRTEGYRGYFGSLVPVVFSYGDYRRVDGVLLPHSITKAFASLEKLSIELHEIVHVESLPEATFEPPAEVRMVMAR